MRGINRRDAGQLLDPSWLVQGQDVWIHPSGALSMRPAVVNASTTNATSGTNNKVCRIFNARNATLEAQYASTATGIYLIADLQTDKNAGTTPSAGFWKFLNFGGAAYAFQAGQVAKKCATIGSTWADFSASSGTVPTGDAFHAAFGRVWGVNSDGKTIKYCALLDITDWGGSDTGSIDMTDIWGSDEFVTAIASVGSTLVVFGRNHIVLWEDASGSRLGIDPTQMAVVDIIRGTGCICRDTVVEIGEGDLWYLSKNGVQSLQRTIASKNNPISSISKYIHDALRQAAILTNAAAASTASATFDSERGLYVLQFTSGAGYGIWAFHTHFMYQDDEGDLVAPATYWYSGDQWNHVQYISPASSTPQLYVAMGNSSSKGRVGYFSKAAAVNIDADGNGAQMASKIITGRIAPSEGRLLSSRGLSLSMQHKGNVLVQVAGLGAEDVPMNLELENAGTSNFDRAKVKYNVSDSTGATIDTSLVTWGTADNTTVYDETYHFECGGEGEWIQYGIEMYQPTAASDAPRIMITRAVAYVEVERGI